MRRFLPQPAFFLSLSFCFSRSLLFPLSLSPLAFPSHPTHANFGLFVINQYQLSKPYSIWTFSMFCSLCSGIIHFGIQINLNSIVPHNECVMPKKKEQTSSGTNGRLVVRWAPNQVIKFFVIGINGI